MDAPAESPKSTQMKSDLEKARGIVRKYAPFVNGDRLLDSIERAVAEGIAVGRDE